MTLPSLLTPDPDTTAYTPPVSAAERLVRFTPVLLVTGVFVLAVLSITPWPVGAYEDDAIYTLLGKALATGDGYRMISLPGSPHATHYPPGYPLLLSVLWRVWPEFPDNVVVFKFANALLQAAAAGGAFWFARFRLGYSPGVAALIAAAGTASMATLQLAGLVMSEPLFVALLFVVFAVVERCVRAGTLRDDVLAGTLLGALYMVRTIGVVAIGAAVLILVLRRRLRSAAVVLAVAALFLVPWQMWVQAHDAELAPILQGKYGSYGTWLADGYRQGGLEFAAKVVLKNLAGTGNTLGYLVMPAEIRWMRLLSLVLLVPFLFVGLVATVKRAPILAGFCSLYIVLLVVWPFHPYRFLLALWPILVIAFAAAVRTLRHWQPSSGLSRAVRLSALGITGYLIAGHAAYNAVEIRDRSWTDLQRRAGMSARPLVEWVVRNTRPDDVLSTEHDVLLYLYTGRRGVPTSTFLPSQRLTRFTPADNAFWVASMVRTYGPRYLITGWPPHVVAADTLSTGPSPMLRRVGAIQHHVIFERLEP